MKQRHFAVLFAIAICAQAFSTNLSVENLKHAEYYENGQLRKAFLKHPVQMNNYECMRWIRFYPDGEIKQFQAATDIAIQGIAIPAESFVFLRENGTVDYCWFSKRQTIQGFSCPAGGKAATGFYETGELRFCFPTEPIVVDSFACKRGGLRGVYLYPDGTLQKGWLRTDMTIDNVFYKKGTQIELDENGTVVATRRKSIWEKVFPMFF